MTRTNTSEAIRISIVKWMSPVDAIDHIASAANCDRGQAKHRLRAALADGRVGVCWADCDNDDALPSGRFWLEASIIPEHGGQVLHQVLAGSTVTDGGVHVLEHREEKPRYRGFLINRADLYEAWPVVLPAVPPQPTSSIRPGKKEIREAALRLYAERASDPPNINEAARLICEELPRVTREAARKVLREDEFAQLRRPSGVRRKR